MERSFDGVSKKWTIFDEQKQFIYRNHDLPAYICTSTHGDKYWHNKIGTNRNQTSDYSLPAIIWYNGTKHWTTDNDWYDRILKNKSVDSFSIIYHNGRRS